MIDVCVNFKMIWEVIQKKRSLLNCASYVHATLHILLVLIKC